jgi:putative flippase GtrA
MKTGPRYPTVFVQLTKAGLGGGLSTLLHYFVLFILSSYFNISSVFGSGLGYVSGAVLGYFLNRKMVFAFKGSNGRSALRYGFVVVFGFALNLTTVAICTGLLGLGLWLGQVVATGLVFFSSFLLNKSWSFR